MEKIGLISNKEITESMFKLKNKFEEIKQRKYIKGTHKGAANAGHTFENLVGLVNHEFEIPDFAGIEIKTKKLFSKGHIGLFSSVPDGKSFFEIKRLVNNYGYPDSKERKFPVLCGDVYGNKRNFIGIKYQYKINVDKMNSKIILEIYDKYGKLIDNEIWWTFELVQEKLLRKSKVLAIIDVAYSTRKDGEYFWYKNINFYELKGFKEFIALLEAGIIRVSINIGVYRDIKRYGQIYDHGTSFGITKENLSKLYNHINI